jgi:hypothetical protein
MLGLLSASSGDIDRGVGKQEHETLASVGGANLKVVSVGWRRGGCADSGRTNEQSAMGTGGGGSSPAALMSHSAAEPPSSALPAETTHPHAVSFNSFPMKQRRPGQAPW